jgi:hypothetical protein
VVEPDGLFSRTTGLMKSDDGIATAKYLVRCALKSDKSLSVKDYTGTVVTMWGELGLANTWDTEPCDKACQEKLSACMLAFTNGTGQHINVVMAANDTVLGPGAPAGWDQEGAFFGNIFFGSDEAEKGGAFWCAGKATVSSHIGWIQPNDTPRFCEGYPADDCPYEMAFQTCDIDYLLATDACTESGIPGIGTMSGCKDDSLRSWSYAITTFLDNIDEGYWGE